jgi:hypothetical protein
MVPLVGVMYSGLTQSVFRLDRVKFNSCGCTARSLWIKMPGAIRVLVLVAALSKLCSFVRLCAWSMLLLGPKASTCALSSVYSLPWNNFVQKLVPQVKKLFVTAFKDLYVSRVPKNLIVIPQVAHQALGMCSHVGFLRFDPPLCDYSHSPSTRGFQPSSASQLGASTRKWGSQFRLGEVKPSFKEFLASLARDAFPSFKKILASPAMICLGLMSINPDVGCKKLFPAFHFLRIMALWLFRLILFCFTDLSL